MTPAEMQAVTDGASEALGKGLPGRFGHLVIVFDIPEGTMALCGDICRMSTVRLLLEAARDLLDRDDDTDGEEA